MVSTEFRKCSSCKKPIQFGQDYWVCNVSTCNRKRTGLYFCSVSCWDAHVPLMNHRDSWAEERRAPTLKEWEDQQRAELEKPPTSRKRSTETAREAAPASAAPVASRVIIRKRAAT